MKDILLNEFKGWHAPIREIISATTDSQILQADIYETPKMSKWASGRVFFLYLLLLPFTLFSLKVALLGDACHATAPTLVLIMKYI